MSGWQIPHGILATLTLVLKYDRTAGTGVPTAISMGIAVASELPNSLQSHITYTTQGRMNDLALADTILSQHRQQKTSMKAET